MNQTDTAKVSCIKGLAQTKRFKQDIEKLSKLKKWAPDFKQTPEFIEVMHCLQYGIALPPKYRDHPLVGKYKGYRDCHIFNDLLLIYKIENEVLYLVRLNTHSEIFG